MIRIFLRSEFLFPIDVGVTLESEGGGFEVEDETDLELGDGQIAEQLSDVRLVDGIGDF